MNFSNKIFDCQGFTIDGTGWDNGIYLYNKHNNTIKNCIITEFEYGIHLSYSSNNTLTNNTANNNGWDGIHLYYSSNNTLTNNRANNNGWGGIYFGWGSNNNTMFLNYMCNNSEYDVYVENLNSATGANNTCNTTHNYNDAGVTGCRYKCVPMAVCFCASCADCTAKLNDPACKEVRLTANITNHEGNCIFNPEGFNNKTFDCQGNRIDGLLWPDTYGIYLSTKMNNIIRNCIITEFSNGIILDYYSNYNTIINNTVSNNLGGGIRLFLSSHNTLINNRANNNHKGIFFEWWSHHNTMISNYACGNSGRDVYAVTLNLATGANNTCNTTFNYNDTGVIGCRFRC